MHNRLNKQNPPMTLPPLKPYFSPLTTNNMKVRYPITSRQIHGMQTLLNIYNSMIHAYI